MTTLHRAIAIVEMDHIARSVTKTLHLNMAWILNILFHKGTTVTKGIEGLVGRLRKHGLQFFWRHDDTDTAATVER
jgi:hypothetical protein